MDQETLPNFVGRWAAVIFAACIAALAATQLFSSYDVDRNTRIRSEQMVANGIDGYRRDLVSKLYPQTFWDDAVFHLDNRFDPEWADIFIADYFRQSEGFETVIIIGADGRALLAEENERPIGDARLAQYLTAAAPMVAQIRAGERARGPLPEYIADNVRLPPIAAQSIEQVDGKVQLMAAALVQPDRMARIVGDRAPIVLVGKKFDAAVIKAIGDRFLLTNAGLITGLAAEDREHGRALLNNHAGQPVASLRWDLQKPGAALLSKTLPVSLLFALILACLIAVIGLRARRLASHLVSSEARAIHLAAHDPLTGLPNRSGLDGAFAAIAGTDLPQGRSFAVLLIDLDQFKAVNDSLGHQAGDELIGVVAHRISQNRRPKDFLARFGGDEFVFILSGADSREAAEMAQQLIDDIAQPIALMVGRVFVGASIGITMVSNSNVDAQEALRRADLALYDAKDAGRNRHSFFDMLMDNQVRNRQELQIKLHDALQHDQLCLHYQPQVDSRGQVIGIEALARWVLPDLGTVEPSAFVQVAEETGLIEELGTFTIRRAFSESRLWPGLPVAINVSAMQLRARDFATQMRTLIDKHGVDPAQFELEITERILLGDDAQTLETLKELRAIGFRIALDDFGTGYSSLGYLHRYPIDKVKIDRSFVARLDRDPQAEAVVVAIVQLAKAFGLAVVAEGVETDAQRHCLNVAGCSDVQGYLTGRPMPADELAAFLGAHSGQPKKATA
nr:EAL domain-containing protein [uncultured Sphingomonas sp.]